VSDYGLEDRAIGVRSPAGAKDLSLTSVSRPALRPTQPPVQLLPGVLSTHPYLVPGLRMSRSYISSPSAFVAFSGTALEATNYEALLPILYFLVFMLLVRCEVYAAVRMLMLLWF
jgi:hypothetical protein